jgi:hypothetical protein
MTNNLEPLLDYLSVAEGIDIHYNAGETDITTPYGVYRADHPTAEIFKYIDSIARKVGVTAPSSGWTKIQINLVNNELSKFKSEVRELAKVFYLGFLKGAMIESFPVECVMAMFSMYTNSPANAVKAVQDSLLELKAVGLVKFTGELSIVDGQIGSKTSNALTDIVKHDNQFLNYWLESLMLSNMKSIYIKLALADPANLRYLKGWDNRMDILQSMK